MFKVKICEKVIRVTVTLVLLLEYTVFLKLIDNSRVCEVNRNKNEVKNNKYIKLKLSFQRVGHVLFKASVRYFSFFHQIIGHLKSSFRSRVIQVFVFTSSPLFFPVSHGFRGKSKINLKV